jgi:hypothetical protein
MCASVAVSVQATSPPACSHAADDTVAPPGGARQRAGESTERAADAVAAGQRASKYGRSFRCSESVAPMTGEPEPRSADGSSSQRLFGRRADTRPRRSARIGRRSGPLRRTSDRRFALRPRSGARVGRRGGWRPIRSARRSRASEARRRRRRVSRPDVLVAGTRTSTTGTGNRPPSRVQPPVPAGTRRTSAIWAFHAFPRVSAHIRGYPRILRGLETAF